MSRQRLLIIVLPALVVGVIEVVSDTLLDSAISFPLDAIVMTLVVLAIAAALSGTAYRRIDSLRATLAARNRELEERAASASALRRVSVAITALADLPEIVDAVVENARTLIGVDAAILLLADGEGRSRYATSSDPTGAIDRSGGLPNPGSDDVLRYLPAELALGRLVAPLQRGRETIGLLAVGSRVERSFDVDDVETLASLADQAAIAIEHARLQDRLRELAVESRARADRAGDARRPRPGPRLRQHQVPGGRGAPRDRSSRRRACPDGGARGSRPVALRRRPRGDPGPAQPDQPRHRSRRGDRGLRRPVRGCREGRGERRGVPGGARHAPAAGDGGQRLPDRPGEPDERPEARRCAGEW